MIRPTALWVLNHTLLFPKLHPKEALLALPAHNGVYSAKKLVFYTVIYPFWVRKLMKIFLRPCINTHPHSSQRLLEVFFFLVPPHSSSSSGSCPHSPLDNQKDIKNSQKPWGTPWTSELSIFSVKPISDEFFAKKRNLNRSHSKSHIYHK